jgi:hypothetical protein
MSDAFTYLPAWQVLLCTACGCCFQPQRDVWTRPLRQAPHSLRGAQPKALTTVFETYNLRTPGEVPLPAQRVPGLRLLDGF